MTESFELIRNERRQLILRRPGQDDVNDVRIRRAFPWSSPGTFISIRSSEGGELLLLENLDSVGREAATIIQQALADGSFIPVIQRIKQIQLRFGHQQWSVRTDRGEIDFRVQEREDVRFLPDGRFNVKDVDGNLYELPRFDQLDDHSRKMLEQLL